ncbi:MAG: uroporphyrinogen decarboxylase family protein [Candidatus Brocadiia bacterium]
MTDAQWDTLLAVVRGEAVEPLPVGFIVDSPWLPGWAGMSMLDYFASERRWLEANLAAADAFPDVLLLPGFWSEFGMCTEPSAFGAKCVWGEDEFPFPARLPLELADAAALEKPDPRTDGLLPLVLKRLAHAQPRLAEAGHAVRFATCRGPLNVASFLVGHTEFLTGMMTEPEAVHALVSTVTDFLAEWLEAQAEAFPTIGGVLVLDDLVGFLGEEQFRDFALPSLERLLGAVDVSVRFLHNDAPGRVSAPYLAEAGVNLFNFSHEHGLAEMRELTGEAVALMGNVPPRDVLAGGSPEDVRRAVREALDSLDHTRRLVLSCGGGMPPGVPTANIRAFCEAARERSS